MALVGVELETLVNEQDALTTRPPPSAPSRHFAGDFLELYETCVNTKR